MTGPYRPTDLCLNTGSWHTNIMIICENLNTANLVEILLFLTDTLQINKRYTSKNTSEVK